VSRRFLIQGARFAELNQNDWLVWEAGHLTVPRGNISSVSTVHHSLDAAATQPALDDPLCFLLEQMGEGSTLTIGRAEGNDLVLSDETVSRHHCTMVWSTGGWTVTCAEQSVELTLDAVPLPYGQWHTLSSGQALGIGHLVLTLFTSHGMALRLAQKLAALSKTERG
jgi:hypothetical protein